MGWGVQYKVLHNMSAGYLLPLRGRKHELLRIEVWVPIHGTLNTLKYPPAHSSGGQGAEWQKYNRDSK